MARDEDREQLRLLNCGDALVLSQFKKRTRLKEAGNPSRSDNSGEFFDNLISIEELAIIFGLAPRTIRNWIARGKIPHVKIGRRNMFLKRSVQEWLNQKEEPQWQ